jgi:hypothetical protein
MNDFASSLTSGTTRARKHRIQKKESENENKKERK